MTEPEKCVLILSGGMDSGTLLFDLMEQGYDIHALTVNYGQRHAKEIECAKKLAEICGVEHQVIDLSSLAPQLFKGSSQTDPSVKVPEGHYAEETMKLTVVPNRNMILLSLAVAYAISSKASKVFYGAHAGDHAIYPDCRPEFVKAMQTAAALCDWKQVDILAPYSALTKVGILKRGLECGVPYEETWTCYVGDAEPCGKCGSCQERAEAFAENHHADPLIRKVANNV
jgi:7-cyano-7-deazaguanine synthase